MTMNPRVGALLLALAALLTPAVTVAQPPVVVEFYHVDAVGSVRAVTNATGGLVRRHDYFPFGEENEVPGSDSRRFAGKERDGETALDYFSARYYAARTGRFTTADPGHVGGNTFDPQSWNAYAYARNNPLRFIDPAGTDYRVNVEGGQGFWVDNERQLLMLRSGGFQFSGGTIYNAAGRQVGTYEYFDPVGRLSFEIARSAGPIVPLIGAGATATQFALSLTNPIASAITNCGVGSCRGDDVHMAVAPRGRRVLGTLAPLAGKTIAEAIRLRGGGASQVSAVATWLQNLPLGKVAELAADNHPEAKTAMKVVKNATRLSKKY